MSDIQTRRDIAQKKISQSRDEIMGPLERELAQLAEHHARLGQTYSSGHVERRLELYIMKAEKMAAAALEAYVAVSISEDDFTVDEIHDKALREIDNVRRRAVPDIEQWAKRFNGRYLDALAGHLEKVRNASRRDIEIELGMMGVKTVKTRDAARRVKVGPEVFVVMSFAPSLDPLFVTAIRPAIETLGLQAYRVDGAEPEGTITETILKKIEEAPVVVGDLTSERPNCYYELGYARGLGKRIVLTARRDHNPRATPRPELAPRVHFDVDAFKITWWDEGRLQEFKDELTARIAEALKGNKT